MANTYKSPNMNVKEELSLIEDDKLRSEILALYIQETEQTKRAVIEAQTAAQDRKYNSDSYWWILGLVIVGVIGLLAFAIGAHYGVWGSIPLSK